MKSPKILSIIPEIQDTRISVFQNGDVYFETEIFHPEEETNQFKSINDQLAYRRNAIVLELKKADISLSDFDAVVSTGGLTNPCQSGVYKINKKMVEDLIDGPLGTVELNLGGLLAFSIGNMYGIKSFAIDPPVVDEFSDLAHYSGNPFISRISLFSTLNHKYLSKKYAESIKKPYEELNIIFCHMGKGSVSVAAHKKGAVVDANQAFLGYGPFGLQSSATVPYGQLIELCFSKRFLRQDLEISLGQKCGIESYLGTSDLNEIQARVLDGDRETKRVLEASAYQIAKEIASYLPVLDFKVDAIILSGKIFSIEAFLKYLSKRIGSIAKIAVYPKEYDMEALFYRALQALNNELEILEYD
jgi:butyrate kinase